LYPGLKLPECIQSIESVSRNWSLARDTGFFHASTFPRPTCRLLAKRGGFIDSYNCLGFSLRRHFRGADVLLAGQTVVSSTRVMVWVFPHVKISRGADVLLGGQTVLAINVFGPNRGTQNTLAAVVGNVNTRSIVLTIHFAGHTVK
jgi:hypothetical protein